MPLIMSMHERRVGTGAFKSPVSMDSVVGVCDMLHDVWLTVWMPGSEADPPCRDLEEIDALLRNWGTPFIGGAEHCIADLWLAPLLDRVVVSALYFKGYDILTHYASISNWLGAMKERCRIFACTRCDAYTYAHSMTASFGTLFHTIKSTDQARFSSLMSRGTQTRSRKNLMHRDTSFLTFWRWGRRVRLINEAGRHLEKRTFMSSCAQERVNACIIIE